MNLPIPQKRHKKLLAYSRDHHFGLLLVWKIAQGLKKAIAPQRVSNYVLYFFDEDLDRHFKDEELLLFSKLPPGNSFRQQAENEHRNIVEMIEKLRNERSSQNLLDKFAVALKEHIRFEERVLFPFMQHHLPEKDLEALGDHSDPRGDEIDSRWEDVFWLNDNVKI